MQRFWEAHKSEIQFAVAAALLFLALKYLLFYIGPFVAAYLLSELLTPVTKWLKRKCHIPQPLSGGVILISLFFLLACGIFYGAGIAVRQAAVSYRRFLEALRQYEDRMCEFCHLLERYLTLAQDRLWIYVRQHFDGARSSILQKWVPFFMSKSVSYIRPVTTVFAFLLVTFVATVLLLKEDRQREGGWHAVGRRLTGECFTFLRVYVWAQLKIMLAIGLVCLAGFCLAGLSAPALWAGVTAFLDMLPFIGTGLVLFPVLLWHLLIGRYLSALVLLLTYVACVLTRQLLEPKLLSGSLGISPLLTLAGIFIGVRVFGIGGIILGPIYVMLLTILYRKYFQGSFVILKNTAMEK